MGITWLRILLVGCALAIGPVGSRAADLGSLDGVWEGDLGAVNVPGAIGPPRLYTVRIVISGANASVFAHDVTGGPFQEVKHGAFHVTRLGPNGIVYAVDSGGDADGTWVETWNFTVTLKQNDKLIINLCRMVNNIDLPTSVKYSKFTENEAGELTRTK